MSTFSERNGFVSARPIQIENADQALRNRIWNYFFTNELKNWDNLMLGLDSKYGIVEEMLDRFGHLCEDPGSPRGHKQNTNALASILISKDWYFTFEFIENYLALSDQQFLKQRVGELNKLLEEEKSGYRIVILGRGTSKHCEVTPITNQRELQELEMATKTIHDSVNTHIAKAIEQYTDRRSPDYKNSIKESICAVESLCCIITGDKNATLGQALKKLEENRVNLHSSFKEALNKLYGYTSDEEGIRHGSIGYADVKERDARFMLIICSAFVNYLTDIQSELEPEEQ